MPLTWIRVPDGEHYGRPIYEYEAQDGDRHYRVTWACDHGGMFGYTAYRRSPEGRNEPLARHGITWARTLKRCKEACEQLNAKASQ